MFGWLKRKNQQEILKPEKPYEPGPFMPLSGLAPAYRAEIERLEAHLVELIAETEALAQLKLVEWQIRRAEERKVWLERGVAFPKSRFDEQQDRIFYAMEAQLRREKDEALKRVQEIERNEKRAIEYQSQDKQRREQQALAEQRRHELELQRIEAQKAIAVTISQALREDLE